MAENQENPLPPAIAADPINQNPAPRTMYDYAKPTLIGTESSIVRPAVADENPNTHLENFLEFCYRFKINGVFEDAIHLWLFPFSLRNKAKQWLNSLPRGSSTTWEQITEKYKDLLRRCPHHGLPLLLQVQTFYNGVNPSTRQVIDAAADGTINNKTPKVELLNKKIDGLRGSTQVHPVMRCDLSGGGIHTEYQPFNPTTEEEQVHYMGNQRPHNPSGFQQPPYQQEKKPNLEEMLTKFISVSETHFQNTEIALKNQQASIQGLETQIGQLSKLISERPQGSLPSNTEPNPGNNLMQLTLEIRKEYKPRMPYPNVKRKDSSDEQFGKFLKLLEKLHINLPFIEALSQMPNAMKFLKELLANKKKLD
ncbi:hypothetical protein CXB51_014777 [Gossypium anomalum]|uniref:Retrotransposon gag domain-containing protein n=1 Tax=Gossypium anomalum TaxID=47600 RepID=A0A8J5ZAL3_9ROSI|nr:hypothetical protein CXB51_014777 [Gossypium anomalum]